MFESNEYKKADIKGHEDEIIEKIEKVINDNLTLDDDKNLRILNKMKKNVSYFVDAINSKDLRVDGYCVKPILEKICKDKIISINLKIVNEDEV